VTSEDLTAEEEIPAEPQEAPEEAEAPAEVEAVEAEPAAVARPRARAALRPPVKGEKRWYVVHTFTGHENKVKTSIERRAVSEGLGDKVGRILVLTEEELRGTRRGKKQVRKHKVFPGYVIVEMELINETRHLVRSTAGVTGFVGPDRQPVPLQPDEVEGILGAVGEESARVRVAFEKGDMVRIVTGPFENFHGRIDEINIPKEKLRVLVSIFGRDTPVEVDLGDVERLS
jgi:transcriptional antiterminator NusG